MRAASLAFFVCFYFNVRLINGQFAPDGQFSRAFGGALRAKRGIIPDFLVSNSVSQEQVKFFMYRKAQNDHPEWDPISLITGNSFLLKMADFDPNRLTKIFIHGYKSDQNKTSSRLIREAFFKNEDFNVIIVDWNEAQHNPTFGILYPYDTVFKKIDAVGEHVSNMLLFLESQGLDLSTTTVVGQSLGAHIAGIAGHKVDGRIGRIVGLDPSGPLITKRTLEHRLSEDDAVQVEVIHSETDQYGLKSQMGHYDFYPNSGHKQPGCHGKNQCSHARSYHFFVESLDPNTKGFYARLCDNWMDMLEGNCNGEEVLMGGLNTKTATHGMYYLKTNNEPPFARGHSSIEFISFL